MNFSCDRCHKRFSTTDEPVPGRTYRIPCGCGSTIVLEIADPAADALHQWSADRPYTTPPGMYRAAGPHDPDPFAAPDANGARDDEPSIHTTAPVAEARGMAESAPDVTPTFIGPLARRDPSARLDESSEYRLTGAISFDDVLRRTRRQGFLAGIAAGAVVGAIAAVALIVAMSRLADTAAPPPEPPAQPARAPEAAAETRAAPAPTAANEGPPAARRTAESAGASRPVVARKLRTVTGAPPPAPVPEPEAARPTDAEEAPADDAHATRETRATPHREASAPSAEGGPEPEPEPARTRTPAQPADDRDGDPDRATDTEASP